MIHDSSDSEDENFCGTAEQFTELFRRCKSGLMPQASPTTSSEKRRSSSDTDSPTSSKRSKEDNEASADLHDVSTDSCNSVDSDVDNILAEYREFAKTYKGEPKKGRKSSGKSTKKGKKIQDDIQTPVTPPAPPPAGKGRGRPKGGGVQTRSSTGASKKTVGTGKKLSTMIIDLDDDDDHVQEIGSKSSIPKLIPDNDTDDYNDIIEVIPVAREQTTVRVRWKGTILRFRPYETETIGRIKELVSEAVNGDVDPYDIVLYDGEVALDDWKTIKETNLGYTTIIEGMRKVHPPTTNTTGGAGTSSSSSNSRIPEENLRPHDPTLISLRIQDGSLRKKTTIIYVKKTAPLTKLPELYLEKTGLASTKTGKQVKFMLDGELLDLNETPNSLDFEEDECIDVIVK